MIERTLEKSKKLHLNFFNSIWKSRHPPRFPKPADLILSTSQQVLESEADQQEDPKSTFIDVLLNAGHHPKVYFEFFWIFFLLPFYRKKSLIPGTSWPKLVAFAAQEEGRKSKQDLPPRGFNRPRRRRKLLIIDADENVSYFAAMSLWVTETALKELLISICSNALSKSDSSLPAAWFKIAFIA